MLRSFTVALQILDKTHIQRLFKIYILRIEHPKNSLSTGTASAI
jgi:hypothetical protein